MRCEVHGASFRSADADALVVAVREGQDAPSHPGLSRVNAAAAATPELFAAAGFKGEADKTLVWQPLRADLPKRVVFVGLGKADAVTEETWRRAGAHAARSVGDARSVAVALERDDVPRVVEAFGTGFFLARYKFDRFLSSAKEKEKRPDARLLLLAPDQPAEEAALATAPVVEAIVDGVTFARDLANLPGNHGTPLVLAREAQAMAKREGIRCRVHDEDGIARLGMGAFRSVSLGSVIPPRLLELEYGSRRPGTPTVALVGKGLTFDSGGISIKPAADMDKMRYDKSGGAAVLGVMLVAARLRLPVHLVAIVPCTENMPGRNANKPGDVVEAMNGKTIEILNTDAEGRLLLADGLCYADQFRPDVMIDVATLTGACAATFANHASGLFSNDDELSRRLTEAGNETFERVWRLPIFDDYEQMMKGTTADLKNIGGPRGGAITAAAFLRNFVNGRKWAHLDVAGTAWDDAQRPYHAGAGATGVGVRLIVRYLVATYGRGAPPARTRARSGSSRKARAGARPTAATKAKPRGRR
ncbi:MAG TPA: leucyl aminopeptidase [Planctomycetota bacterium]|nr:leucyl aminopeptidase [Planctomycetota bacterium]